jgi:hypothetical protein
MRGRFRLTQAVPGPPAADARPTAPGRPRNAYQCRGFRRQRDAPLIPPLSGAPHQHHLTPSPHRGEGAGGGRTTLIAELLSN